MDRIWLIVKDNGEFWIVQSYDKPKRVDKEIMETDYDNYDWDYHGHHMYKEKGTGKFEKTWNVFIKDECWKYFPARKINKKFLHPKLQGRTYNSEPILINE